MNRKGAEVLTKAALDGVQQIFGAYRTDLGRCAIGVLCDAAKITNLTRQYSKLVEEYELEINPTCGECGRRFMAEHDLITHLNDDHRWDFLAIARKLGPA